MRNMTFWETAISIFFVFNSMGMIPVFVALLGRYSQKKQMQIIVRELLIALFTLLIFTFFGGYILKFLQVSQSTIGIAGGILLVIISLQLIFPKISDEVTKADIPGKEPFIIPLAIPGLAGPGSIAALMVLSNQAGPFVASGALLLAWVPSLFLLLSSSFLKKMLGEKGLVALEKLGGMILSYIGIEIFTNGVVNILKTNFPNMSL